MDNREQGSHAQGMYPTQYTSYMRTARVYIEEADTKIIVKK